jgi:hypothetical protein
MAALPDEFDFDPLAPGDFLGTFIRGLDYERRRQLTARGGGSSGGSGRRGASGGSGRRGGRRPEPAPVREAKSVLRATVKAATARGRRAERAAAKFVEERAYAQRVLNRSAVARLRAQERELLRLGRAEARAAKRARTALRHFLVAPSRRTPYQRRVVSTLTRQTERGETTAQRYERYARALDDKYAQFFEGYVRAGDTFRMLPTAEKDRRIAESARLHRDWIDAGQPESGKLTGIKDYTIFYHSSFA